MYIYIYVAYIYIWYIMVYIYIYAHTIWCDYPPNHTDRSPFSMRTCLPKWAWALNRFLMAWRRWPRFQEIHGFIWATPNERWVYLLVYREIPNILSLSIYIEIATFTYGHEGVYIFHIYIWIYAICGFYIGNLDGEWCTVHRGNPPQCFNMFQVGTVQHSSPELRWGYTRVSPGFCGTSHCWWPNSPSIHKKAMFWR